MHEDLRSGLLLFALLTLLSAVPVVLRRLRPALLALVHAQALVVVLALVAAASAGEGDARPLLLPYLVGLTLAALFGPGPGGSRPVSRALTRSGLLLGLVGVAVTAGTLLSFPLSPLLRMGLALLAMAFGALAVWRGLARKKAAKNEGERRADRAAVIATGAASLAVAAAMGAEDPASVPWPLLGLWAPVLGLAAALTTSARLPPFMPPTAREAVSALFVGLALAFAAAVKGDAAIASGLLGALVTLAVLAATRPLLVAHTRQPRREQSASEEAVPSPLLAEAALAHMSPMLDDGLLSRPRRPHVNARVTARHLLDASLERARAAGPPGRRSLGVEVREEEADVDVEGDPGELAEALCAVLDNALGLKQRHPALRLRVHVRGSSSHVTFEVEDDLARQLSAGEVPGPDFTPFAAPREGEDASVGVGLARARLLVARHGGVLLSRRTPEGSCVQLTVPRRRARHPYGLA